MLPSGQVVDIPTTLDIGADTSLVSIATYTSLLSSFPLFTPPRSRLTNFDGTPIEGIYGAFRAPVRHGSRTAHLTVYVVPNHMPCTTGSDAIQLLHLVLEDSTQSVRTVSASTPPTCLNDYPELLSSTLGTYPNFSHTITLRENAQPSAQRVRMLPIAQRETVKTEINRMVQQGIWEPCDRSDWAHGLVPVWK